MARLFEVEEKYEKIFLEFLSSNISRSDFSEISRAAAFYPPNDFEFADLLIPLRQHRFPEDVDDARRYVGAIYDCGYQEVRLLPKWASFYICSLYIYSNRLHLWSIDVESDYFYIIITNEMNEDNHEGSLYFLRFLEWLYEYAPQSEWYDEYFLLLSWILLHRLVDHARDDVYGKVMKRLLERDDLTNQELSELTVSDRDMFSWLDLHKRLPLPYGYSPEDYESIICGRDWVNRNGPRLAP